MCQNSQTNMDCSKWIERRNVNSPFRLTFLGRTVFLETALNLHKQGYDTVNQQRQLVY